MSTGTKRLRKSSGPRAALCPLCRARKQKGLEALRAVQGPIFMQPRRPKHSSTIEEFVPREQRPKVHPAGRRCRSCNALLSIYNELSQCWACNPVGRKIHKYGGQEASPDIVDFQELMEEAA